MQILHSGLVTDRTTQSTERGFSVNHPIKHILLPALFLLVSACNATGPVKQGSASPVMDNIESRGELILGTSANMDPMTYVRDDGKVVGVDVDIARFMANSMDVKLTIKTLPFSDLIPALQRGEVDVVISNMTITQKRNMKAAFVGPYMTSGKCIVTKQDNLAKAEEAKDLNTADTVIAVMEGTTSQDFVATLLPNATIVPTRDQQGAIDMVKNDQAGGMLTDYPVCLSTLKNNPDAGFITLFSLLSYEPIGIALPSGDPLLINWTENFLKRMEAMGALDEISARWFGEYADAIKPE